jgi:hypothetical protein
VLTGHYHAYKLIGGPFTKALEESDIVLLQLAFFALVENKIK